MKLGVQLKPEGLEEFEQAVVAAEESGFECIYLVDGQLLWRDLYVYMTKALMVTERIKVSSAVTNPFTRHFSVTANAHATLDEMFPGRVMLGIGRGDNAVRTLGLEPVKTRYLAETVPLIRGLLQGDAVESGGVTLQSQWIKEGRVPILMAGTGPKNLELAGALADRVMIQIGVNPESCEWAVNHVRRGAAESGRDPNSVKVIVHGAVAICEPSEIEDAYRACSWEAELISIHVGNVAKAVGIDTLPSPLQRLARLDLGSYDYRNHLNNEVERDERSTTVIDDCAIIGSESQIAERLEALAAVGISEFAPAYLNGRADEIRRLGQHVLPLVHQVG